MGVAGMKWRPHLSILYLFFTKLNEETLLKVSLKNLHFVSKLPIFQKHWFFNNGPKNLKKVENSKNIRPPLYILQRSGDQSYSKGSCEFCSLWPVLLSIIQINAIVINIKISWFIQWNGVGKFKFQKCC